MQLCSYKPMLHNEVNSIATCISFDLHNNFLTPPIQPFQETKKNKSTKKVKHNWPFYFLLGNVLCVNYENLRSFITPSDVLAYEFSKP